jgi:DNA end-binding protein Ku
MESVVAPRAYWKGYLKLSLVSCPVALFPASSEREKISFNQINKNTGNRIRYRKVDAETGDEVDSSEIIKGYEVGKGQYIEIEPEELEAIAIESKRTIEIDEFVPNGKGLLGITLRYPYEVRKEDEYFEYIPNEKIPKDMLELALAYRRDQIRPLRA